MLDSHSSQPVNRRRHQRLLLIALVLLVAGFFRLWQITGVPPGLASDEADFGNAAIRIIGGEYYIVSEFGHLISYLEVPFILALGRTPLALRLPGALSGILAAVVLYLFVEEAFQRRIAALFAGLIFAVTMATIHLSRLAFPPNHLPLLQVLTYYFFWRGWRREQNWSYALSGLFLGLSLHTYQSAVMMPVVMALFWIGWLWRERGQSWRRALFFWLAFLVPAIPFALAVVPSLTYASSPRYTEQFIFNSAVHEGHPWRVLAEQIIYHAGMFGLHGDPIWRHNLPGRPLYHVFVGLLFWGGVLLALKKIRSAPYAFLLLQFGIMLLPGLLARVDDGAHFLHASGVLALSCVFPALFADRLVTFVGVRRRWAAPALVALLLMLVAWEGYRTYVDYFQVWPDAVEPSMSFDELFVDVAQALNENVDQLVLDSLGQSTASWQPGQGGWDVRTIAVPPGTPPGDYRVTVAMYDAETQVKLPVTAGPKTAARVGDVSLIPVSSPSRQAPAPEVSAETTLGDPPQLRLSGFGPLPQQARPGDRVGLKIYWQALQDGPTGVEAVLELRDPALDTVVQTVRFTPGDRYGPAQWKSGEWVTDRHDFWLDRSLPAGPYQVHLLLKSGAQLLGQVDLGNMEILGWSRQFEAPPVAQTMNLDFGGLVKLVGYELLQEETAEALQVVLCWQALAEMNTSFVTFIHMLDDQGVVRSQMDSIPGAGRYPTTAWLPDEYVCSEYQLPVEGVVPPGTYSLVVGVYDPVLEERLPLDNADGENTVILTSVMIEP